VSAPDHNELVKRSFTRQVHLFSGPDSIFAERAASAVSWIEPLAPEMIVLDVACGAAHVSEPLAPHVHQIVAVDLTRALLDLAATRLREQNVRNVLLQEANAEALPFLDESFDIVFCRSSLHHFSDAQRAVAEMTRVCRAGGRVVLMDLVAPSDEARDLFDHVHRLLDPSHVRTFLEPELAELAPGELTYANTAPIRMPIDVAVTEQSDRAEVERLLRADADRTGASTGFDPVLADGKLVVSFTTCVVHGTRV
jgi:SAM-dependent methyltransferase